MNEKLDKPSALDGLKSEPAKERAFGTPYDDVFRTLLNDCSELVLPVLNEIFGEHYSGTECIVFSGNEHYLNRQGGKEERRITDSAFTVIGEESTSEDGERSEDGECSKDGERSEDEKCSEAGKRFGAEKRFEDARRTAGGGETEAEAAPQDAGSAAVLGKKYLFECQSTADSSLLIRIFEYAAQIALDDGELTGNRLKVTIPHSAVLFLRSTGKTPEEMRIELATPGGTVEFPVRVMKIRDYSLEEIFSKKLLFLIPFYIFTHEKRFRVYERDSEKLEQLKREYARIAKYLETMEETGEISVYTKRTLAEMTGRVTEGIAAKYANVREGVKSVMGGKILEYEAKTILRRGIEEGRERGREEGRLEGRKEGRQEGIQEGRQEGRQEGIAVGKKEGILITLSELVRKRMLTVADAAKQAGISEEAFLDQVRRYEQMSE